MDNSKIQAGSVQIYVAESDEAITDGDSLGLCEPGTIQYAENMSVAALFAEQYGDSPFDYLFKGYAPVLSFGLLEHSEGVFDKICPYMKKTDDGGGLYHYSLGFEINPGTKLSTYAKKWGTVREISGEDNHIIEMGIPVIAAPFRIAGGQRRVIMVQVFGIVDTAQADDEMGQFGPGAS